MMDPHALEGEELTSLPQESKHIWCDFSIRIQTGDLKLKLLLFFFVMHTRFCTLWIYICEFVSTTSMDPYYLM